MLGRAIYREKRYECGEYQDVYIFRVWPGRRAKGSRRKTKKPTSEVQKNLNRRHREEKLARLIHANFTEKDLSITLTFRDNPPGQEEAKKEMQKYLRRLRREYRKQGLEFKYIWVMEQSQKGRIHFHCIFSGGLDRDKIEQMWGHGYANTRRLQFGKNGVTELASYISKEKRTSSTACGGPPSPEGKVTPKGKVGEGTYRSYNGSKNLYDPPAKVNDSKIRSRKAVEDLGNFEAGAWEKYYPGFEIGNVERFFVDEYGTGYLFARLHRILDSPGSPSSGASRHLPPRGKVTSSTASGPPSPEGKVNKEDD